jgi:hypothetical protein
VFAEFTHPVLRNLKSPTPSGASTLFMETLESGGGVIIGKMRRASITSARHTTDSEHCLSSDKPFNVDE